MMSRNSSNSVPIAAPLRSRISGKISFKSLGFYLVCSWKSCCRRVLPGHVYIDAKAHEISLRTWCSTVRFGPLHVVNERVIEYVALVSADRHVDCVSAIRNIDRENRDPSM
jgi:hypothetical protein